RWSDTREKLLQGAAWQANRIQVSRSLGHSLVASEVIEKLTSKLDESSLYMTKTNHIENNF
ncbi:MAG: hypothetical protein NTZ45_02245, partial [Methylococcales bacterium]|nr:hypothetical protein [Methylococcales bacterium]